MKSSPEPSSPAASLGACSSNQQDGALTGGNPAPGPFPNDPADMSADQLREHFTRSLRGIRADRREATAQAARAHMAGRGKRNGKGSQ